MPNILDPVKAWEFIDSAISSHSAPVITSGVIILLGISVKFILALILRPWRKKLSPQSGLILRKAINYSIFLIVTISILQQFGVRVTAILGAAGIAGIAIGFAAQTSLSNFISGLFLIWEKPFEVGDVIRIGGNTGTVESIDLMSLTLRTFDNLSVRLPNEMLVKGELVNVTRYPIRRYNIELGVHYREDPARVVEVLKDVAHKNTFVLDEPEPLVSIVGFGESQLNFIIGVWHEKNDFIPLRNSILTDIKNRFNEEGIEIPFPHRVIVSEQNPPGIVPSPELPVPGKSVT